MPHFYPQAYLTFYLLVSGDMNIIHQFEEPNQIQWQEVIYMPNNSQILQRSHKDDMQQ